MQHLEFSGAVRSLKWPLGVKWLKVSIAANSDLSGGMDWEQ